MIEHPVSFWVYIVAALLLSVSLFFGESQWQYNNLKRVFNRLAVYFFSFSPAALLFYMLYEISHLR